MSPNDLADHAVETTSRPRGNTAERRPRTAYVRYRRYRSLGRFALLGGAAVGLFINAYALGPLFLAGVPVPQSSLVLGLVLLGLAAVLPYAFVRWRWSVLRQRMEDD